MVRVFAVLHDISDGMQVIAASLERQRRRDPDRRLRDADLCG